MAGCIFGKMLPRPRVLMVQSTVSRNEFFFFTFGDLLLNVVLRVNGLLIL